MTCGGRRRAAGPCRGTAQRRSALASRSANGPRTLKSPHPSMCGRCLRERLNTKGRIVLAHPVVDRKAQQDSQLFQDVVGRAARPLAPAHDRADVLALHLGGRAGDRCLRPDEALDHQLVSAPRRIREQRKIRSEGMAALVQLDPAPMPPLPEIDESASELANEVLSASRELMLEVAETRELSLEDCTAIACNSRGGGGQHRLEGRHGHRCGCQLRSRSSHRCAINSNAPRISSPDQTVRVRCSGRTGLKMTASSASAIVHACQPRRSKLCNAMAAAQTQTTRRKTR
jgi:hypothetical protein